MKELAVQHGGVRPAGATTGRQRPRQHRTDLEFLRPRITDRAARPRDASKQIAFSPDGIRLISASIDGTARVCDTRGKAAPVVLRGHSGTVEGVAFSPDGDWVASAGKDSTVRLWRTRAGGEPVTFEDFGTFVESVTFTSDAKHLATSHGDGSVRLWRCDACGPIQQWL
ncbi:WD40 repeat domain-containing protein [Streptomyces sp. NPDC001840]